MQPVAHVQARRLRVPLVSGMPAGDGCGPPAGGMEAKTAPLLLKDCPHRGTQALGFNKAYITTDCYPTSLEQSKTYICSSLTYLSADHAV